MADDLVSQLDKLFDKKLSALREHVDGRFREVGRDNLETNNRITRQSQRFTESLTRLNNRLDLVAAQVVAVGDDAGETKELVSGLPDQLERIERSVSGLTDRLDQHAERLQTVEAKTRHLPTPTK